MSLYRNCSEIYKRKFNYNVSRVFPMQTVPIYQFDQLSIIIELLGTKIYVIRVIRIELLLLFREIGQKFMNDIQKWNNVNVNKSLAAGIRLDFNTRQIFINIRKCR